MRNGFDDVIQQQSPPTTTTATIAANSNRLTSLTRNGAPYRTYTHDAPQRAEKWVPLLGQELRRFNRASRFSKKWFPLFGVMRGNTVTDTRGAEVLAFDYNARNRNSAVSGGRGSYIYNAFEQMVSRTSNSVDAPIGTVHYIYDTDGQLIAEANGSTGAITREYVWLPANDNDVTDLPLAVIENNVVSFVHTDHLGRPIRMTNMAKASVWNATWTPWGAAQTITGSATNNLRFPCQFFLIETGLAYNWHRTYDPATGRYTQPDPLRFVDGPSVYAYAGSSPFMSTDREGRFGIPGFLIGASANAAAQFFMNVFIHNMSFSGAALCIDLVDVAISGAMGAIGGGVAGNVWKGNYGAAAVGGGAGFYYKKLITPVPLTIGSECDCKRSGTVSEKIDGFIQ